MSCGTGVTAVAIAMHAIGETNNNVINLKVQGGELQVCFDFENNTDKTIFTTNSSTIIPSEIVSAVNRPEKFLALHFANEIWDANVAEVMGHPETDAAIFDQVVEFVRAIGMVPVPIHKEHRGYVLNSLLIPSPSGVNAFGTHI